MDCQCPKCKSKIIAIRKDSKGASAYCDLCDTFIKRVNTGEIIEYFNEQIRAITVSNAQKTEAQKTEKMVEPEETRRAGMPCRWCKEKYFYREGRLGTIYKPIELTYCPRCGRKVQPDDLKY